MRVDVGETLLSTLAYVNQALLVVDGLLGEIARAVGLCTLDTFSYELLLGMSWPLTLIVLGCVRKVGQTLVQVC